MASLPGQIIDNSAQVLEEFENNLYKGLNAVGLRAERHAKANCPVDTGRLRNSITFATERYHSAGNTNKPPKSILKHPPKDAEPDDYEVKATPEKATVYIGTNVEYAELIEENDMSHTSGRAHFLRDAASTHGDEYKDIMLAAMKS